MPSKAPAKNFASANSDSPPKSETSAAKPEPQTPPPEAAKASVAATSPTPAPTEAVEPTPTPAPAPAPAPAIPLPVASPEFRAFAASVKIAGVFQGANPRALINGRMMQVGEVVDHRLRVVLDGIDIERKQIVFKDSTGAIVTRRF